MTKQPSKREMIYNFIVESSIKNGYPPTRSEIKNALGLSTTSLVQHHLLALVEEGRLRLDSKVARGIVVLS